MSAVSSLTPMVKHRSGRTLKTSAKLEAVEGLYYPWQSAEQEHRVACLARVMGLERPGVACLERM
jgi:hypothetical protein